LRHKASAKDFTGQLLRFVGQLLRSHLLAQINTKFKMKSAYARNLQMKGQSFFNAYCNRNANYSRRNYA